MTTNGSVFNINEVKLKGDGLVYVPGSMHGVRTSFLFDTGASYTIIDVSVFRQIPEHLRPQLTPTEGRLRAANGQLLHLYGSCCLELDLAGTGVRTFEECVVAELGVRCILGLREMIKVGAMLDLEHGVMKLNKQLVALHYNAADYPTIATTIGEHQIPPKSRMDIIV
jgi:hypothetical protein